MPPSSSDSRRRALFVIPSIVHGGAAEYALRIARACAAAGRFEVHGAFPFVEATRSLEAAFAEFGAKAHPLDFRPISGREGRAALAIRWGADFLRTRRLLRELRPGVVHITLPSPNQGLGAILACARMQIPTTVVFQWSGEGYKFPRWRTALCANARRRGPQQWVAISRHNARLLAGAFRIPPAEITCIYNGIPMTKPDKQSGEGAPQDRLAASERAALRRELGVAESSRLLLTVARLDESKGYEELARAAAPIAREFPDVCFVWMGEGPMREALEKAAREMSSGAGRDEGKRAILTGHRADVSRFLRACDLFVFPTHAEGLSFALLEALAARLPVVASDASSNPEVVRAESTGVLFRTGDARDLESRLRWALAHPGEMKDMAARGRDLVEREFTAERMDAETVALLDRLARRTSG